MTVDLDALEALYRDDKKRPVGTIGQADVLALIAELRQERERADEIERVADGLVDPDSEYVYRIRAALSRAEETIADAREILNRGDSEDPSREAYRILSRVPEHPKEGQAAGFRRAEIPEPQVIERHDLVMPIYAEPQGEPTDAQVLAAMNAYNDDHDAELRDWSPCKVNAMRAALRAAGVVGQGG